MDPQTVERLRRKLKYFFMSPCEKYRARGRKPWKLLLQILKIVIITIQLVSFGLSNEMMVSFKKENSVSFRHLFLKDFQDSDGPYAVYTKREVFDHINYIIMRYLNLENVTVGNHAFEKVDGTSAPLYICQEFYRHGSISPENGTFNIDPHVEKECVHIYPVTPIGDTYFSNKSNFTLDFNRLLCLNVYFKVKAINMQTIRHDELPDCYNFSVKIMFDNRANSGQIKVSLSSKIKINVCKDWKVSDHSAVNHYLLIVLFDSLVILACFSSMALCTLSLINAAHLFFEYAAFVSAHYKKSVPWAEKMEFVNSWDILSIISDTLTVAGSVLKICIQSKELTNYNECSILLGFATILVWTGAVRYLGFFQKYNILILTVRAALPSVIRFSLCAVLIYLSYCICGWIVLGPHHENFRSFNMVAYCLFSMINGDAVYATFTKLRASSFMVWLFSRVYIYSFISIFTYMVLSLFIAIITDTYETIKQQDKTVLNSELKAFVAECQDPPDSGRYKTDQESSSCISCMCCG